MLVIEHGSDGGVDIGRVEAVARSEGPHVFPLLVVEDVVDGQDLDETSKEEAYVLKIRPGVLCLSVHAFVPGRPESAAQGPDSFNLAQFVQFRGRAFANH